MMAEVMIGALLAWSAVCAWSMVFSGFYSGMETAIYLLKRPRVELRAEAGRKPYRVLRCYLEQPERFLAVVLIGTNIHNYLSGFALTGLLTAAGLSHGVAWVAMAIGTPVFFVFNDCVPKNVFQRRPEPLAERLAGALRFSERLFQVVGLIALVRGVVWAVLGLFGRRPEGASLHHHRGLATVLAESHATGALTAPQHEMARRTMHLNAVAVRDVMKPWPEVVSLQPEASYPQVMRRLEGHDHSRLPVRDEAGQVEGIVDIHDLLGDPGMPRPADRMTPPVFLPDDASVTEALYTLRRNRRHMGVVRTAGGEHLGIVTIKDLAEAIVGQIEEF